MKNYTIHIHQNKNNCVLIAEDIDEFTKWVIKKVNEEQKQSIKILLEDERHMNFIKGDCIGLVAWIDYLNKMLDSSKFEVIFSVEL